MTPPPDVMSSTLGAAQAGTLARWQVLPLGLTDRMIRRRLANGRWSRLHPGVYALSGVPPSWLTDVWGAVLAVGREVTVTHETALLLQDAASDRLVPRRPIILTAPHGSHPRVNGAVVHQLDDLRPGHVRWSEGLKVSTPARAIVDIAATGGERFLARLVDHLLVERQTSMAALAACFHDVLRPGKPGMTKLARVLDDRGSGYVAPASELEVRLLAALDAAGLPPPERQVPLPPGDAVGGCADVGYRDARLLVEADGRRWHTKVSDFTRDRRRDAAAAKAGWLTLRFSYDEITQDPVGTAATVAEVRRVRLAGAAQAAA